MNALRVLHCPTTVGGNPASLARAERAIGLDSRTMAFTTNYLRYPCDEILFPEGMGIYQCERRRVQFFRKALREYDVIHYNFGETIFSYWTSPTPSLKNMLRTAYGSVMETAALALLKRSGIGIAATFQGDDARQGDYCRNHFPITFANEVEEDYYTEQSDQRKRKRIAMFDRYADLIYAVNPDLLHVLPARTRFMPYANVDLREVQMVRKGKMRDRPVVVHAPTHRKVKGTHYLLDAVAQLKTEGIPFEFLLVEGLSNEEALRLYTTADLFVDQLLAGWYGGVAVEVMALGTPVICYLREDDLHFLPEQMRHEIPLISADPHSIYTVLKQYLTTRKHELPEIGRRSRDYVEQWHDPIRTANELKHDYQSIPSVRRKLAITDPRSEV